MYGLKKKKYIDTQTLLLIFITSIPFLGVCKFTTLCNYDYLAYYNDTINIFSLNTEEKNYVSYIYYLFGPFIKFGDVSSLGFINRILYIIFFVYFYKKKFISKNSNYYFILIFYPSAVLYSNLGGEENITAITISIIVYSIIIKKYLLLIIFLIILYFIKINLFFLMVPAVIFIYLDEVKKYKDLKYYILAVVILFFLFPSEINKKIEYEINWRKFNLLCEDINYEIQRKGNYSCENIENRRDDVMLNFSHLPTLLKNSSRFLLSPLPDRITKISHKIQFIENILILIFLTYYTIYGIRKDKDIIKIFFIFCFFVFIYGNIFSNPGSAIRWKYSIIFMYMFYINLKINLIDRKIKK